MNITFLIGNGFDVGMGLRTKFKDFYPIYIEKSQKKKDRIKKLADKIKADGEDYKTWADFETAMGKYTEEFTLKTKQDFLDQIKDFELEFMKYLQVQENAISFSNSTKDTIGKKMKIALTQFFSTNNLQNDSSFAVFHVMNKYAREKRTYNFINFNYTSILEKCLNTIDNGQIDVRNAGGTKYIDEIGKVIHIHGFKNQHPMIGVNDKSQIVNKDLANDNEFISRIVKPLLNERLRNGNNANAEEILKNSTIICTYGMSLGATDGKWWDLIVKWLSQSPDHQLIIFDYDKEYQTSSQFDFLDKEDSLIKKLNYPNNAITSNIEKLRPQIHIAIHKNIFRFNLINENLDAFSSLFNEYIQHVHSK